MWSVSGRRSTVRGAGKGRNAADGPGRRAMSPPLPSVATALDSRIKCATGRVRKVVGALFGQWVGGWREGASSGCGRWRGSRGSGGRARWRPSMSQTGSTRRTGASRCVRPDRRAHCWALASAKGVSVIKVSRSIKGAKVTFALPADESAAGCSVVGDFNGWRPGMHQLRRRSNGTRSASVVLPLGTRTRFRYLGNNGHWFSDPDVLEFDGLDSVLAV